MPFQAVLNRLTDGNIGLSFEKKDKKKKKLPAGYWFKKKHKIANRKNYYDLTPPETQLVYDMFKEKYKMTVIYRNFSLILQDPLYKYPMSINIVVLWQIMEHTLRSCLVFKIKSNFKNQLMRPYKVWYPDRVIYLHVESASHWWTYTSIAIKVLPCLVVETRRATQGTVGGGGLWGTCCSRPVLSKCWKWYMNAFHFRRGVPFSFVIKL